MNHSKDEDTSASQSTSDPLNFHELEENVDAWAAAWIEQFAEREGFGLEQLRTIALQLGAISKILWIYTERVMQDASEEGEGRMEDRPRQDGLYDQEESTSGPTSDARQEE